MSTYTTKTERVNTEAGFKAVTCFERTIKSLEESQVLLNQLVHRLHRAMRAIAEQEGAFTCEHCGAFAFQAIEVASYSDEMGREVETYCPACAPMEVN